MKDSILLTIIAGVTVFVLGQFVLKLVLEPVVSFKESLGNLSAFCLRNRAKISNANATPELAEELKTLTAIIISKRNTIPAYSFFSFVLRLPKENEILKGCQLLNGVAAEMVKDTSQHQGNLRGCIEIVNDLQNVGQKLKVRLDYSEL